MLRPRVIPCLLLRNNSLVKTVGFAQPKYVGDPINAVRIFNEKEVDELIVADIDATVLNKEPNYRLIESLATECRMPLCYAGGVKNIAQVERIISLGVEKVALSSAVISDPEIIARTADRVGRQSIVVVLDVRQAGPLRRYEVFTHNGTRRTGLHPAQLARQAEELGAGEILLNSIDRDGGMKGYDLDLVSEVRSVVNVPMSVLGGAGSMEHIASLVRRFGVIGAAAGSLFVFKGRFRAVLINYPDKATRDAISAHLLAVGDE